MKYKAGNKMILIMTYKIIFWINVMNNIVNSASIKKSKIFSLFLIDKKDTKTEPWWDKYIRRKIG